MSLVSYICKSLPQLDCQQHIFSFVIYLSLLLVLNFFFSLCVLYTNERHLFRLFSVTKKKTTEYISLVSFSLCVQSVLCAFELTLKIRKQVGIFLFTIHSFVYGFPPDYCFTRTLVQFVHMSLVSFLYCMLSVAYPLGCGFLQ